MENTARKISLAFFTFVPVEIAAVTAAIVYYAGYAGGYALIWGVSALTAVLVRVLLKKTRTFVYVWIGCIIGFYSFSASIYSDRPIQMLLPIGKVRCLIGYAISSPVVTSGGTYRINLNCTAAESCDMYSSATGIITVFIPASIIEIHYPGRLYSLSPEDTASVIDVGSFVRVCGSFSDSASEHKNGEYFYAVSVSDSREYGKLLKFFSLLRWRAIMRLYLKRIVFSWSDVGGLLLALILGSREYLSNELSVQFKDAGLAHVLALSGMHLSLFGAIAYAIGAVLGGRTWGCVCSVCMCVLFYWFAGYSPSLLRALLFVLILLLCRFASVRPKLSSVLALAFLVQQVLTPSDASDLSFMLSYAAMLGLIVGNRLLQPVFARFMPKKIATLFAVSCGAQIITTPVTFIYFKIVSFTGIFSTIVVSPFVSLFFIFGLFAIIISVIFPAAINLVGIILTGIYNILCFIVRFFAHFIPIDFS